MGKRNQRGRGSRNQRGRGSRGGRGGANREVQTGRVQAPTGERQTRAQARAINQLVQDNGQENVVEIQQGAGQQPEPIPVQERPAMVPVDAQQVPVQRPMPIPVVEQPRLMADQLLAERSMRTWILGDSIIRRAGNKNTQLHGGGECYWDGKPGGQISFIISRLRWLLGQYQFPTTIILHIGTNDIFKANLGQLRSSITEMLMTIRQLLPFTRIVWSDILFRWLIL
ncbi:uncharacterized protein [Amphiura filiformis]|uniref:uncharacterized protein n=1 Tax=Amphiura filiformis TaxID=82378 RepID=UPI003B219814